MGVLGNPRISEEKGLFLAFSGFPRCSPDPPEKAEKGGKGRFRPISRTGSQTPLEPPFVTPAFAAVQEVFACSWLPSCFCFLSLFLSSSLSFQQSIFVFVFLSLFVFVSACLPSIWLS